MKTLHLNFYELSLNTQTELKQHIKDNAKISMGKRYNEWMLNDEIDRLLSLNNAGIDIDIYAWMTNL